MKRHWLRFPYRHACPYWQSNCFLYDLTAPWWFHQQLIFVNWASMQRQCSLLKHLPGTVDVFLEVLWNKFIVEGLVHLVKKTETGSLSQFNCVNNTLSRGVIIVHSWLFDTNIQVWTPHGPVSSHELWIHLEFDQVQMDSMCKFHQSSVIFQGVRVWDTSARCLITRIDKDHR